MPSNILEHLSEDTLIALLPVFALVDELVNTEIRTEEVSKRGDGSLGDGIVGVLAWERWLEQNCCVNGESLQIWMEKLT